MAQRNGLLLVPEENVLCFGAFQRVVLFFANVISPEGFRKAVDMGCLEC